jgi:hypothetical protein
MSTTDTTSAVDTTVIDRYVAAWNEADSARRAALIDSALGADLCYRDPMFEADGRDAFDGVLAAVQQQLPGHVVTRTSDVDAHHDVVRFNWALGLPCEPPTFTGLDVAKLDSDGRLHRIVGFAGETIG